MTDVFVVLALLLVSCGITAYVSRRAPMRHARYRMRATLADLIYRGRLTPVAKVKNGKIVR